MTTTPNDIVTTGDFIAEWMEDEGINAAELARRLGTSRKHVSELLSGKAPLSHDVALDLERVTGVPARLWNLYEAGYRGDLARRSSDEELAGQYEQATAFPLAYLRKFKFITAGARDHAGTVRELLSILGVADFDAFRATWSEGSVAYRRSAIGRDDLPALATWLSLAERHADGVGDLPLFDRAALAALVEELRHLTAVDPNVGIGQAVTRLRDVGVVLCFIPAVPGLGLYGATRWLNGHPVVQLSLLRKTDDQFWFTLFHELGHVLIHGDKALYLNGKGGEAEDEADRWASDTLIPHPWSDQLPTGYSKAAVVEFAEQLGIAPGVVLGRIQRETQEFHWGNDLKRKFEWVA